MADKIGEITVLHGTAVATGDDGSSRLLSVGSPVFLGDTLQTDNAASLLITLDDGRQFDMGRNSVATMHAEALQQANINAQIIPATAADVESLQQAISEGLDPSELEAPAAGAGVEGGSEGQHAPFYVDYLAPETIPTSGFDTTGIDVRFDDPLVENAIVDADDSLSPLPPAADDDDNGGDTDPPSGNGGGDNGGSEPPISIETGFPLAQSGVGHNAWLQTGNLNQFNALVVDHELGYGVSQTGQQPGRTDGLDNNESLLFKLSAAASQLNITIQAEGTESVAGTLIVYDAERTEIGRLDFNSPGEYLLIDDAGEIIYLLVNGDSPDNHGGFYVSLSAQVVADLDMLDDFEASSAVTASDWLDDADDLDIDSDNDTGEVSSLLATPVLADIAVATDDAETLPRSYTVNDFDHSAGDSLNLSQLLNVSDDVHPSEYINISEQNGHLQLAISGEPGGETEHVITLSNTSLGDFGLSNVDLVLNQAQILDSLLDTGVLVIDPD